MALLGQPINSTDPDKKCLTPSEIATKLGKTTVDDDQVRNHIQNCGFLNSASVYFDATPMQLKASGQFHYFCTRNNAFSNRSQKASLTVVGGIFSGATTIVSSTAVIAFAVVAFVNML
jgi:hypothetical protein